MASISIPYGYRNVKLAERVAAANHGVALEQHPAGFVTVEASPRLRITREMVREAYGRDVTDATWRGLATTRRGVIALLSDSEIEIQDDVLAAGFLVNLPSDLCREAEALAVGRGQSLRDFVVDLLRRELGQATGLAS